MRRLFAYLKAPPARFALGAVLLALGCVGGSLALLFMGVDTRYAWMLYAPTAAAFAYGVYLAVRLFPRVRARVRETAARRQFSRRLTEDYEFRTIVFAWLSFAVNAGYALLEVALGILGASPWYGALALYYATLGAMRLGIVLRSRRVASTAEARVTYRGGGAALIAVGLVLTAAVAQMGLSDETFRYGGLTVYAAAAFTFYKLTAAVVHLHKAKKYDGCGVRVIRNLNFADALVSMLALQTALLSAFSEGGDMRVANVATGTVVCAVIVALGIRMLVRARRYRKETNGENEHD